MTFYLWTPRQPEARGCWCAARLPRSCCPAWRAKTRWAPMDAMGWWKKWIVEIPQTTSFSPSHGMTWKFIGIYGIYEIEPAMQGFGCSWKWVPKDVPLFGENVYKWWLAMTFWDYLFSGKTSGLPGLDHGSTGKWGWCFLWCCSWMFMEDERWEKAIWMILSSHPTSVRVVLDGLRTIP